MRSPEELREKIASLERENAELRGVRLLVGGLAHDFNNLLTAISGHAAILEAGGNSKTDATRNQVRRER